MKRDPHRTSTLFNAPRLDRRTFISASASAACFAAGPNVWGALSNESVDQAKLPAGTQVVRRAAKAKSVILFFLCGGSSHLDLWDLKPEAPSEYRGPFRPIGTSAPGVTLSEHLPLTAKFAHHLAIVHGISDRGQATGDHHAGYYYQLTGRVPDITFRTQGNDRRPYADDWPFVGSVIGMAQPSHPTLPQVITLPHRPSKAPYTRPGQFAGRLGAMYDPFLLQPDPEVVGRFLAPSLSLSSDVDAARLDDRRSLLEQLDASRRLLDHTASASTIDFQRRRAFELLTASSTAKAFDLADESPRTRERYGSTINGASLLMARRLVEAEVPFITVFWREDESIADRCKSEGGWDTHGNNFGCLEHFLLPEFDQIFSALVEDLAERGLLDQTLLLVTSEMGRKPKIGDPRSGGSVGAGRDHWTACMSVVMAGGGIRGGLTYNASDARAEYPDGRPIGPDEILRTVYHAMGIDQVTITDAQGRPIPLLDQGGPLVDLFG